MATDLELAYQALTNKKSLYDKYWAYYDSQAPLVYSRERLRQIFKEIDARFTQNWCAVVVDSVTDRIQLRQFTIADNQTATDDLAKLVDENELLLEADNIHLAALVTGESFAIVWPDADNKPQAYYNDPRMCHAFYYADNPRRMRFGAKWWEDGDQHIRMTLYYADRLEYYRTPNRVQRMSDVSSAKAFEPYSEEGGPVEANPFDRLPLFHFRRDRRAIRSELLNVIEPQDAINKLLNDMMIAGEFGAFKQRWIITNANTGKLKNAPNEIWRIPAGMEGEQNTTLGEFAETDLGNYIAGIDKFANAIAIITRTPKHYFFNQGGDPSGEALIAQEAPLNKKAQKYIDRFSMTWRKLVQFMLALQGEAVDMASIATVFDLPETVQPRTQADIIKIETDAKIPLKTSLRNAGWTEADIEQMEKDRQEEQALQNEQAQVNLDRQRLALEADRRNLNGQNRPASIADRLRGVNGTQ